MDSRQKFDNPTNIQLTSKQRKSAERKKAKALFLESLRSDPSISRAAEYANIHRDTAYDWKEKDPQFAKDWADAQECVKDTARSSIYQRGIIGYEEPLVSMGQVVCEQHPLLDKDGNIQFDRRGRPIMVNGDPIMVRKYSDSLAALYAKSNLKEFKEKQSVNVSGSFKIKTEWGNSAVDEDDNG